MRQNDRIPAFHTHVWRQNDLMGASVSDLARVSLCLRDSVDQPGDQRDQRCEEPQAPPHRARHSLHHLVPTEAAKPIERPGDSPAAAALVKLEAAVRASRLFRVVQDHGRLVAARAQARRDQGERR